MTQYLRFVLVTGLHYTYVWAAASAQAQAAPQQLPSPPSPPLPERRRVADSAAGFLLSASRGCLWTLR